MKLIGLSPRGVTNSELMSPVCEVVADQRKAATMSGSSQPSMIADFHHRAGVAIGLRAAPTASRKPSTDWPTMAEKKTKMTVVQSESTKPPRRVNSRS